MPDRALHRPLGNPHQFRQHAMTHRGRIPARAVRLPVQLQIHQERRAGAAVRYEVAHERIDNVGIQFHRYSNHSYSNGCQESSPRRCFPPGPLAILNRMIKRIKFLGIPVRDQDRALRFYTEKLGFRILTDQEMLPRNAGLNSPSRAPKPASSSSPPRAMRTASALS